MPTYQYACTECGDRSEVVQRFTDDPLTECSACGGKLRKVFSPVGIVFKGSGFYRTDSRNGSSTVAAGKDKDGASNGSGSSDTAKSPATGTSGSSSSESAGSNGSGSNGSGSNGSGSSGSSEKKSSVSTAAAS